MAPLTRRSPPNHGVDIMHGRRAGLMSQDKLTTVVDKTIFKPCRKDPLSLQFTKLSMADLAHESGKLTINGTPQSFGSKLLSNLLEQQTKYLPQPDYLKRVQKDQIKEFMRYEIVNWLLELNKHFEYHSETFGVAVNIFDRVLSQLRVQPRHLQLIAATSLLLGAKMQEQWNTHPSLKELTRAGTDFVCTDIERMEKLILNKLEWNINPVTPYVLLHQMVPHLGLPASVPVANLIEVAEDILDRCHLEYRFLQYKPSTLAACAIMSALGRWVEIDRSSVASRLMHLAQSRGEHLDQCLEEIKLLNWDVAPML